MGRKLILSERQLEMFISNLLNEKVDWEKVKKYGKAAAIAAATAAGLGAADLASIEKMEHESNTPFMTRVQQWDEQEDKNVFFGTQQKEILYFIIYTLDSKLKATPPQKKIYVYKQLEEIIKEIKNFREGKPISNLAMKIFKENFASVDLYFKDSAKGKNIFKELYE